MNIANIFGMHLGVMTKWHGKDLHKLTPYLLERIVDKDWFKNCKLLLTPLEKITEEDKIIFQNIFRYKNNQRVANIKVNGVYLEIEIFTGYSQTFDKRTVQATPEELLWLASKGYDIGIVPDEYKEAK